MDQRTSVYWPKSPGERGRIRRAGPGFFPLLCTARSRSCCRDHLPPRSHESVPAQTLCTPPAAHVHDAPLHRAALCCWMSALTYLLNRILALRRSFDVQERRTQRRHLDKHTFAAFHRGELRSRAPPLCGGRLLGRSVALVHLSRLSDRSLCHPFGSRSHQDLAPATCHHRRRSHR